MWSLRLIHQYANKKKQPQYTIRLISSKLQQPSSNNRLSQSNYFSPLSSSSSQCKFLSTTTTTKTTTNNYYYSLNSLIDNYNFNNKKLQNNCYYSSKHNDQTNDDKIIDDNNQNNNNNKKRFDELDLHPKTLSALHQNGLYTMTEIQQATFETAMKGKDIVGRARTGTGKTLAFLLPSIERLLKQPIQQQQQQQQRGGGVSILIISPTRELADQIHKQVQKLTVDHNQRNNNTSSKQKINLTSQVLFGGTPKIKDIQHLEKQIPTILVATPGRLKDHLYSTKIYNKNKNENNSIHFADLFHNLQVLVLDEMDRLLDLGFRDDIKDILQFLPNNNQNQQQQQQEQNNHCQTMLFSATIPNSVQEMIQQTTKSNNRVIIDCIQDEDPTSYTNATTLQSYVTIPPDRYFTGTLQILLQLLGNSKSKNNENNNKIIAFFPMTSLVSFFANFLAHRLGRPRVYELHSKKSQQQRTTISRQFRNCKSGILCTSDVSARGVDYPNVTHVVQLGKAESREVYIHRLGRTGRAGKPGKGLLLLPQVEESYLTNELQGLNLVHDDQLQAQLDRPTLPKSLQDELDPIVHDVKMGNDQTVQNAAKECYLTMVPYYFQRRTKTKADETAINEMLVDTVNGFAKEVGLTKLPFITQRTAELLKIENVSGLNIQQTWREKTGRNSTWETGRRNNYNNNNHHHHDRQMEYDDYGDYDIDNYYIDEPHSKNNDNFSPSIDTNKKTKRFTKFKKK